MKLFSLLKILLLACTMSVFAEEMTPLSWHQSDVKTRTERWRLTPDKEVEWVFDSLGNRIEWNDWTGKTAYTYDLDNYLASATTPNGEKTFYEHDALGKLLKIIYPSKKEVNYTYAPGGALKTVSFLGQRVLYTYDNTRNLLIKKEMSTGISTEYGYDEARRLSDIIHKNSKKGLIAYFHFEYDSMGNQVLARQIMPSQMPVTTKYTYDRLYRLTEVSCS